MSKQFADEQAPQRRLADAAAYSARIQEAMRYNKLRSSEYPLVMNIMNAVLHSYTEEQWKVEQQRSLKVLLEQPAEKGHPHEDAPNRYEQIVSSLKDLTLWPWQ
ncbi:MAG: hypothetical protein NVS4B9_38920 [Ktedonobacteraceae bacterium]